jgi:hypothetical protein
VRVCECLCVRVGVRLCVSAIYGGQPRASAPNQPTGSVRHMMRM